MAGRKVRDEQEARALLETAERSGLGRALWAQRNGVDGRSLNAWRLNLARREADDAVPFRLVELVAEVSGGLAARSKLTVTCGPYAVEVTDDVDEHLLGRVLTLLAAC